MFRVQGAGFRFLGAFRVQHRGLGVSRPYGCLGCRAQRLGFQVRSLDCRAQHLWIERAEYVLNVMGFSGWAGIPPFHKHIA